MRDKIFQFLQRSLRDRYNKHIVDINDPFRDMTLLLAGVEVRGIVDGGAHHGHLSKRLSGMFPHASVYAFEPFSNSFRTLQKNIGNDSRIKPYQTALSSKSGTRMLFVNAQDSTNALSPTAEMGKKYQSWQTQTLGREEVQVITLDEWAANNVDVSIDVFKLDLQGHELEALKGAHRLLSSTVKLIYTEVEFVRLYQQNCLLFELEAFLYPLGFRLYQLYNLTSGDDHQLVCGDAIFVQKDQQRAIEKRNA